MTLYIGMSRNDGQAIADTDHLRQSVRDILLTPQGSRLARREYGSLLSALIDQPQNPALRLQIMSAVYVALNRWEPRLTLDSITINGNFTALWWLNLPDTAITAHRFPFPYQQEQTMAVIDLSGYRRRRLWMYRTLRHCWQNARPPLWHSIRLMNRRLLCAR